MNIFFIIDILMVIFSTKIVKTYLDAFLKLKTQTHRITSLVWILYIFFQYKVMTTDAKHPLIILIINILLVFFVCRFFYFVNKKTALFLSSILYAIWMLVELLTYNLLEIIGMIGLSYDFLVGSATSKIVMFILIHMLKYCKKSGLFTSLPLQYWIRLFLIPIATIYVIHNTYYLSALNDQDRFFFITVVLMLLINHITFDVYEKLGYQLEIEKKNIAYEQQIDLCNKQAEERELAYQQTRKVRHDLNDYLIDLKISVQSGEIKNAEKKIDLLLKQNQIYKNDVSQSGNLVIDSLINYKYSTAQKYKIDIICNIAIPEHLPYEGSDLCVILGNLLDNAWEAVVLLPDDCRKINLSISIVKGSLRIVIQNIYSGKILTDSNRQILTSKPDKRNHGLGLASVRYTVEKYNGELLIDYKNNIFCSTVLLYPSEKLHQDS